MRSIQDIRMPMMCIFWVMGFGVAGGVGVGGRPSPEPCLLRAAEGARSHLVARLSAGKGLRVSVLPGGRPPPPPRREDENGGARVMHIEVICTGDEVLTGKIVNTNFSYITQKLEDVGLSVQWETTVGDDRENLLRAFQLAGERADAVIVNGGLGPTVDDLSQEIAAKAAGVELELNEDWLKRMEDFFQRRSRVMPPNNRKQAMLPTTSEVIDNPIGTACGFAVDIGRARFYFTPGVPRELRRMLEEQIVPRLLAKAGLPGAIFLKRFHSYGLGESHVDSLLAGVEDLVPDGSVKLGFRAHYPQLETKLTARGRDMDDIRAQARAGGARGAQARRQLHPGRGRSDPRGRHPEGAPGPGGHALAGRDVHERADGVAARPPARRGRRSSVAGSSRGPCRRCGPRSGSRAPRRTARSRRRSRRRWRARRASQTGATHALAVLIDLDDGPDRIEFGGTICLAIATAARRGLAQGPHPGRARLGAPGRGRDGARLPAPLPAEAAGVRADRLREDVGGISA